MPDSFQRQQRINRLIWLEEAMLSILGVRSGSDESSRRKLVLQYISHECEQSTNTVISGATISELGEQLAAFTDVDLDSICNRSLFYACDDLIDYLCHRKLAANPIAKEEAILYIQDRLQRDGFHRIQSYRVDSPASFKTYIWQVVSNLLIDFSRANHKVSARRGNVNSAASNSTDENELDQHNDEQTGPNTSQEELNGFVAYLLSDTDEQTATATLRRRLRPYLKLTSRERLFLKALCQHDLTIGEIRQLPGFEMSQNDAYRFYYQLLDKLTEQFKQAGVLDEIRQLVSDSDAEISLLINGCLEKVSVKKVYYLKKGKANITHCHTNRQGEVIPAIIESSFSTLKKKLGSFFTPINPNTAIADHVLENLQHDWDSPGPQVITIENIEERFPISKSNLTAIRLRFYAKRSH